jgi:hypothetical protein
MNYVNRIIVGILCAVAAMVLYTLAPDFKDQSYSVYISLLSLACLYLNIQYAVRGIWSASSIFIIIFWCFHFGVIVANATGIDVANMTGNDVIWRWINSPFYPRAEALAVLGISAFALVTLFRSGTVPEQAVEDNEETEEADNSSSPYYKSLRALAYFLLVAGIGYWSYIMASMGGLAALFAGYAVYLKFIESYPIISTIYWSIGVGFTLLGVLGKRKDMMPGIILFAVWGSAAFVMGLRGEVMYPASAFLVVLARRVKLHWKPRYFIVPVVLLSLISFVREYRIDGTIKQENLNPVYGLLEMGGSLQTVVITEEWVANGLDKFRYGETLFAPFERLVYRLTLVPMDASQKDFRLMNVAMSDRNGPYGFSPIAEGFINMGAAGVVAIMMLLSLFLNYFDARPVSILTDSYLGGIIFILFTFIRNAFTHIPGQSLLLAVTLTVVYAFFKRKI